jgi:hypothetical protein
VTPKGEDTSKKATVPKPRATIFASSFCNLTDRIESKTNPRSGFERSLEDREKPFAVLYRSSKARDEGPRWNTATSCCNEFPAIRVCAILQFVRLSRTRHRTGFRIPNNSQHCHSRLSLCIQKPGRMVSNALHGISHRPSICVCNSPYRRHRACPQSHNHNDCQNAAASGILKRQPPGQQSRTELLFHSKQ